MENNDNFISDSTVMIGIIITFAVTLLLFFAGII